MSRHLRESLKYGRDNAEDAASAVAETKVSRRLHSMIDTAQKDVQKNEYISGLEKYAKSLGHTLTLSSDKKVEDTSKPSSSSGGSKKKSNKSKKSLKSKNKSNKSKSLKNKSLKRR